MATKKTTKSAVRSTPATKVAAKQTTVTTTAAHAPAPDKPTAGQLPADDQALGQTLRDHSLETHQAAAGLAQLRTTGHDAVDAATAERVDAINAAVEARNAEAKQLQEENDAAAEAAEAERVENASVELGSDGAEENALRVPAGAARPATAVPAGIHPDVTSPVTGPVVQVPGTGVARLSELAPGQSLAPSPPISSSNILPQPDNPSFG